MNISVVIPTYNSSVFIRATLDSVLAQSLTPHEIIVVDDGSTDDTRDILAGYGTRIKVVSQTNGGTAKARNTACRYASGEIVAFLDHDDLWHPEYLEYQHKLMLKFPEAVASFLGHETFVGNGIFAWPVPPREPDSLPELLLPHIFIRRYHTGIGPFMSMSFCCLRKAALEKLGDQPFNEKVSGVDDFFLFNLLPLFGPIASDRRKLSAYRISSSAQSANRLKASSDAIRSLEMLKERYGDGSQAELREPFNWARAVQRREFAKILMGAGEKREARRQFIRSMFDNRRAVSTLKSLFLYGATWLPQTLQPKWLPPTIRSKHAPTIPPEPKAAQR